MWPELSTTRPPSNSPAGIASGSRCCSLIASGFSDLAGYACAARGGLRMSSSSQQSPRI
jgi:hypothetical protein